MKIINLHEALITAKRLSKNNKSISIIDVKEGFVLQISKIYENAIMIYKNKKLIYDAR